MTNAYEKMSATIEKRELLALGGAAVLMVSGGSDSVALAYLMARYRNEHPDKLRALTMFHMNHKLRGEDADADARFVVRLAASLEIPLFSCEMDIAAEAERSGGNVEAVARRERYSSVYEAMMSMCQHEGIPISDATILTAHTTDDRIENFYMRSIVGTGPGGFRSMLFKNGHVRRPLLECSRVDLRTYIESEPDPIRDENEMLWREDATNAHTDRFRAYVRHEIVPVARQWNENLDETLTRTMDLIADEDDMLQDMTFDILTADAESICGDAFESGAVLAPSFGRVPKPLQRRAVRNILKAMLGGDERINTSSVDAVLKAFENGKPRSGYVDNIQGDIAVSSNKQGVRIEPMGEFRSRRKRN